ncbi:unnamed protein product [Rotaria magnacalcarata]|uniref:Uncharacterized protein n=1 Tax=Rotaria magnacalcarata TaxID=392030 RepID=A0A816VMP1_9BILA|nr:unnamed protein product [Rotaria magnacalcarata]
MGAQREDEMNIDYNYGNQKDLDENFQLEHGNAENKEQDFNDYQYGNRKSRKRRNDMNDQEHTTNSIYSPKCRLLDQSKGSTREKRTAQETETTLSYLNNNHILNKQSGESSIIIIRSLRLSARWGQPFTRSDFSMPVDLAQGGTGHVHCADTILLCHLAILCMDVPFEIFLPFYQILDVLLVSNHPFCICGQITLVSSS